MSRKQSPNNVDWNSLPLLIVAGLREFVGGLNNYADCRRLMERLKGLAVGAEKLFMALININLSSNKSTMCGSLRHFIWFICRITSRTLQFLMIFGRKHLSLCECLSVIQSSHSQRRVNVSEKKLFMFIISIERSLGMEEEKKNAAGESRIGFKTSSGFVISSKKKLTGLMSLRGFQIGGFSFFAFRHIEEENLYGCDARMCRNAGSLSNDRQVQTSHWKRWKMPPRC